VQAFHARSEVSLDPSAWVGLGMQANEVSFDPSLFGREPIADDYDEDDEEEEEEDMEKGGEGRRARGGSVVYVYTHARVHVYTHARVHAYTRACTYAHTYIPVADENDDDDDDEEEVDCPHCRSLLYKRYLQ